MVLGFRVWGPGFGIQALKSGVRCLGSGDWSSGSRSGIWVLGSGVGAVTMALPSPDASGSGLRGSSVDLRDSLGAALSPGDQASRVGAPGVLSNLRPDHTPPDAQLIPARSDTPPHSAETLPSHPLRGPHLQGLGCVCVSGGVGATLTGTWGPLLTGWGQAQHGRGAGQRRAEGAGGR